MPLHEPYGFFFPFFYFRSGRGQGLEASACSVVDLVGVMRGRVVDFAARPERFEQIAGAKTYQWICKRHATK
jgi:hypothetical protein